MRRAFTLVELCMGLAVTSMMMMAAAAFMMGTASAWKASKDTEDNAKASQQLTGRLQSMVRSCSAIGAVNTGTSTVPAAALIWLSDKNGDGKVQTSELALVSHDTTSKQLNVQFPVVSGVDSTWTPAAFTASSGIDTIRAMTVKAYPFVRDVTAVNFAVIRPASTIVRATIEYDVTAKRNNGSDRYYGSASVRTPLDPK